MNLKRILPGNEEQPDPQLPVLELFRFQIYVAAQIYHPLVVWKMNCRLSLSWKVLKAIHGLFCNYYKMV